MSQKFVYIHKLTTNQITGIPIFFLVMYFMFFFSICFGGAFQTFFSLISQALFIDLPNFLLNEVYAPYWLRCLVIDGIGRGVNVTITFIPILMCMFFFLSFLENSGYIARASFVMKRFMIYLGLPSKIFIPMLMGFGCNVHAILGTRILDNKQERILTAMMVPFISCGSKLAIYAIFASVFFHNSGQNVVFLLYITGMCVAIFTGLALKSSILKAEKVESNSEFPLFKFPNFIVLCKSSIKQLRSFIVKAGSIIIPFCMILCMLDNVRINSSNDTILSFMGKKITPIFNPMGIQEDNWHAVVGLITGVVSKEVILGTLNTLYEREHHIDQDISNKTMIKEREVLKQKISYSVKGAFYSIPANLMKLKNSFVHPFAMASSSTMMDGKILGTMHLKFSNSVAAFSYLLFILLYCPCLSVLIMIVKELGLKWALFSMVWTTGLAYIISVAFYQIATNKNSLLSILWIFGIITVFLLVHYLITPMLCLRRRNLLSEQS